MKRLEKEMDGKDDKKSALSRGGVFMHVNASLSG